MDSVTDLPRDRQQIRNVRRNLFSVDHKDEFAAILQKCKVDNDEPFIRCIQAVPEPACILATDHQLKQVEVNCIGENFSIVTVDPTFNLGDFYVTPVVFMQKKFVRKHTEQHPICLGPLLIHQRMNYSSYCYFASQLAILQPSLRHVRAIGTDGEQALHDAMLGTFTEAIPLRCFRHFRDNLIRKLRELNVTECGQEEIMKDVFGGVSEDELHLGLVDSEDQDTFKAKLASLKDRWNGVEVSNRRSLQGTMIQPEFYDWFCKYKAEDMSNTMIRSVRNEAGLSSSDGSTKRFYTNASESLNQMLKDKVNYNASHLHKFIDEMCDFVKRQENDMKKAVCRAGDWRLHLDYSDLQKSEDDWMRMSTKARQAHLKKVFSLPLRSTDASRDNQACSEEQMDVEDEVEVQLSCGYETLLNKGIHESTLGGIWKKASRLVNTDGMIVPIPGSDSSSQDRMVASTSGTTPHIVQKQKKGGFKCDTQCPMYSSYKLCSHIVAVAEQQKLLKELVDILYKSKAEPNLTSLVMTGMPKSSGKKPGAKVPRKRSKSTKPQPTTVVDRIPTTTNYCPAPAPSEPHYNYQYPYSTPCTPYAGPSCYGYGYGYYDHNPRLVSSPHPFTLKFITNRISKCQGCGYKFREGESVIQPPYDLVVARLECRPYFNKQKQEMVTPRTASNAHYHLSMPCIIAGDPLFDPQRMVIPPDVADKLQDAHKCYLSVYFNVFIP